MAYAPDAHQRLDDLSEKYRSWYLSQARQTHDAGRPVLNADGIESSLSDCYQDAMVTAHALYVYLMENPPPHGLPPRETVRRHFPPPVDVLDEADQR